MGSQLIEYLKEDPVALVVFSGEEFTGEAISVIDDEFSKFCSEIASEGKVRVLTILLRNERSLCLQGRRPKPLDWVQSPSIVASTAALEIPVVIGIDGHVLGQGLELALACDIRVAGSSSRFGLLHVREGLIPWDGGTQRLPRLIGKTKAMEMLLTGESIDASEALRIGLIHKTVAPAELKDTVLRVAQDISSRGPIALRYAKEAVNRGMDLTLDEGLRLEADLYLLLHTTRDRTEGIRAFQEKRKPRFEGK